MEIKCNVLSAYRDYVKKKNIIVLETDNDCVESASGLCGKVIRATLKQWKEKRSLDANSYAWVLMTKIADAVSSSKEEIYEEMLQKYGVIYEDENGCITMTVRTYVDMAKIGGHWKFVKSNGTFSSYLMIKGSSDYDTAEMSHFIDRIVEEAKELGIETATPDELERMKAMWKA